MQYTKYTYHYYLIHHRLLYLIFTVILRWESSLSPNRLKHKVITSPLGPPLHFNLYLISSLLRTLRHGYQQ